MINPLKQMAANRTGLYLTAVSILFVCGWRLYIVARQPAHWLAFATELGSVGYSEYSPHSINPSPDNTCLLYERETETGIGTFFYGMASGQSKLLFEQKETNYSDWRTRTLGWARDSSLVACAVAANLGPGVPSEEIVLYNGTNGDVTARIPAGEYAGYSQFTWLSPQSFAYSSQGQTLAVVKRQSDGQWAQSHFYEQPIAGPKWQGFKAYSPQSVVWQEGRTIWRFDFDSASSAKIWDSPTNKLESFACANDGNLRLHCSDKKGQYTILFAPPGKSADPKGTVLGIVRDHSEGRRVQLSMDRGLYTFTIERGANSEPTRYVWEGMATDYRLNGDKLYFVGNRPSGLPGLWQYDVNSKTVSCLVSGAEDDLKYASIVAPQVGMCTNGYGKQISYHLWKPMNVSPGKKYPLILGQTHYVWNPYPQIAAHEGYYFATADRTTWANNIDNWPGDVLELYATLVKNPMIDTNRVFLYAFSAEGGDVLQVLNVKPDLATGVILFVPGAVPIRSNGHPSRMFIAGGADDDLHKPAWYALILDTAAKAGTPVRIILQPGSEHLPRSVATERERARQFARFLLEN